MKFKKYLLLLLLPLAFILTGCKTNELDKIAKELSNFTMEIVYNDDHTLSVKQKLEYRNETDTSLSNLMLHLYPRSFREGAKSTVISKLNYDKCYYNGRSYGDINISKVMVEDTEKEVSITGNDEDILEINFDGKLAPDSTTNIYLEYVVTLPNINHRFGYGESTINIANFYPIPCMYEDGNFVIALCLETKMKFLNCSISIGLSSKNISSTLAYTLLFQCKIDSSSFSSNSGLLLILPIAKIFPPYFLYKILAFSSQLDNKLLLYLLSSIFLTDVSSFLIH